MWGKILKKTKVSSFKAKDTDAINRILDKKGINAFDIISIVEKSSAYYIVFYLEEI